MSLNTLAEALPRSDVGGVFVFLILTLFVYGLHRTRYTRRK